MSTETEVKVGLLGFGTVGTGVVSGLTKHADRIAGRTGIRPVIGRIADVDLERRRDVDVDRALFTRSAEEVVDDPDIRIVVELIGGTGVARALINRALRKGKAVVTANKALLAEYGGEIFPLAMETGAELRFGASVGGGIPIIRVLREGLVANRIDGMQGILNGTCNYILTRMEAEGLGFDQALRAAQDNGFAEADPALDIDGYDTAHKAVLLASLAYGCIIPMSAVHVEGIRNLSEMDLRYGLDLGYRIKLLAVIRRDESAVEVRVHPALVPVGGMLASVNGVFNAVLVHGDLVGNTMYYGRGAGRDPTASTVIADIVDLASCVASGFRRPFALPTRLADPEALLAIGNVQTRYYLRMFLLDRAGVLGRIAAVLGKHDIGIASVMQKETGHGEHVPVVILTHRARERAVDAALGEIRGMDIVGAEPVRLRIEE